MQKQIILALGIVMAVFGFHIGQVKAVDITFTEDGVIREPNIYDNVYILNNATVDMTGGTVTHDILLLDQSTLNFSGGSVSSIWPHHSSTVNIIRGNLHHLHVYDSSLVNIYDVEMINTGIFVTSGVCVVNIYGGNISVEFVKIYPDSKVSIFGGNISFRLWMSLSPNSVSIHGYDFNYDPDSRVFTGSLAYGGQITITHIWPYSYENLNLVVSEPVDIVAVKTDQVIAEKAEMLEAIDEMLDRKRAEYDVLEELLEAGNYADLSKADIIKAKQKIHSAIQHQEQSKEALEKSIEKLEDVLVALAWDPLGDVPFEE